ncbi:MAG: four helix bundle protein [Anaerolineales bacterium]|jgi:four helix bundle protein
MSFEEWEKSAPETFKADTLWKVKSYRLALYLSDLCWQDATALLKDKRTVSLADQVYRAVGSVSANLAEGYSRSTGKDRALFYQYALGSARESRDWYYKARFILGDNIFQHRAQIITEILRLLLTMIPQQRGYVIREDSDPYEVKTV